jgi:hypothetical protein
MSSRGSLQRKCVKGHPKAAGKCSGRCIRYYPRLELPRAPDGTRRFEALGGYPTRSQAEAALADALARHAHGLALDPAKLTLNQYLDRWLAHIRSSLRARTVARYTALLRDHVRPHVGARHLKQLTPLEVQAVYDRLAVGGRRDGQPGGLAPPAHPGRAPLPAPRPGPGGHLAPARPAMSPPIPPHPGAQDRGGGAGARAGRAAVGRRRSQRLTMAWPWTMLAVATGARNGEMCGLEWADLDLDAGAVRFRQALIIIDPAVLPDADPDSGGRRKELAVGPVKSAASSAMLTLPPFAVQALRQHRRQHARLRLACRQPQTVTLRWVEPGRPPQPVQLDLAFRTERGTPVNPTTPAGPSPASPPASAWWPILICCAMRWRRRWRPTRNRPASSLRSCAMPTAAGSPSASTSISFPRPPFGWRG